MALMDRFRRGSGPRVSRPTGGAAHRLDHGACLGQGRRGHLDAWVAERRGVEGFVEPRTAVSDVTLLLVAHDGEWTRRRVPSVKWAHDFCNKQQVPSYDAAVVGIPQRMRDYNRASSSSAASRACCPTSRRRRPAQDCESVRANSTSVVTATPVPPLVT